MVCRTVLEQKREGKELCTKCCTDDLPSMKEKINKNNDLQLALQEQNLAFNLTIEIAKHLKEIVMKRVEASSQLDLIATNVGEWGLCLAMFKDDTFMKALKALCICLLPPILRFAWTCHTRKLFAVKVANTLLCDPKDKEIAKKYKIIVLKDDKDTPTDIFTTDIFLQTNLTLHPCHHQCLPTCNTPQYIYYVNARLQYEIDNNVEEKQSKLFPNAKKLARKKVNALIEEIQSLIFPGSVKQHTSSPKKRKEKDNADDSSDHEEPERPKSVSKIPVSTANPYVVVDNNQISEIFEEFADGEGDMREEFTDDEGDEAMENKTSAGAHIRQDIEDSIFSPSPKKRKRNWIEYTRCCRAPPIKKLPDAVKIPRAEYDQFFAGIGGDEVILKEGNPDANKGPFRYVIPEIFTDLSFYEEDICCMANNPKRGNPNHIACIIGLLDPYSKLCNFVGGLGIRFQNVHTISLLQPSTFRTTER